MGDLGKDRPLLEIWLDRFSGHEDRKLWACIYWDVPRVIERIAEGVSGKLTPVREIGLEDCDLGRGKTLALKERLPGREFNVPILERHRKHTYLGFYDSGAGPKHLIEKRFSQTAAAFFESVARTLPQARPEDDSQETYPQIENRKRVVSHLRRERSRLLASVCKERDKYTCQVCGLLFEDVYGEIGREFAEAHHRVALSSLQEGVMTKPEDLVTVCANCHRMLHRMEGKAGDVERLKAIVRKRGR
ncbi:MAG: HNH endonuclease [Phycisphaerae bacterium]|nr:HNH endonuclease [Phycisphaerae bacterium]